MKKSQISCLLIIHNEEKFIKSCLESIKNFVDDIIIVHDGFCSDNSLNIARKYTNKIFEEMRTKNPEFLKVKYLNLALKNKKLFNHNWLLSIDADEILNIKVISEISNLNLSNYNCVYLKRKNLDDLEGEGKYFLRLFKRDKVKLVGFYHNDFIALNPYKNIKLNNFFLHKKYLKNVPFNNFWLKLEAEGLILKKYNFYNFSKKDLFFQNFKFFLSKNLFFRKIYAFYLYNHYLKKYGIETADLRLRYFNLLTSELKLLKNEKK